MLNMQIGLAERAAKVYGRVMQETDSISHTPAALITIEPTPSLALDDGTRPWLHQMSALPIPAFMEFEYRFRELTEIFHEP